MVSGEDRSPGQNPSWDATWTHLTGWCRWLRVPDTQHSSLSDVAVGGEWLGLPGPPLAGMRVIEVVRTYVAAFVDQYLRYRHQPLLAGPSSRFPEVHFAT